MTEITALSAAPAEMEQARRMIEDAGTALAALRQRLCETYAAELDRAWQGDARLQFDRELAAAARALQALCAARDGLDGLLTEAIREYGGAERDAKSLAADA